MLLATLTWPLAVVIAVSIATVGLLLAILLWQTFAIVVRDDRRVEREQRLGR
jgi:hypothetical protein